MVTCSMYLFFCFWLWVEEPVDGFEISFPLQFSHNQKEYVISYVQSHLSLTQIGDRFLLFYFFLR